MSPFPTPALRVAPESDDPLDLMVGEGVDAYQRDFSSERVRWIAAAARHHIEHSVPFQRLAEAAKFDPDALEEPADLANVPLLPSSIFKRREVRSATHGLVVECRSSGTQGTRSTILRDEPTLERFVASMLHGAREFLDRHEVRHAFVLAPSTEEAGDLWFSYVLGLIDVAFDASFFVRDEAFRPDELFEALRVVDRDTQPVLIGPPALIQDFTEWLNDEDVSLDLGERNAVIVTAGGWKARQGEAVDRPTFASAVSAGLNVPEQNVRDFFNMVELNTVIFECERGAKHIPPWLEVMARRADDMSVLPTGEEGVLTFLDPTATSYPCFLFSDDVGAIDHGPCACGRVGSTMQIARRLQRVEERGCALKMDRYRREGRA